MSNATPPPAGRNAPCPCGSGKKWKKCCGTGGGESTASPEAPPRPAAEPVAPRLARASSLAASGGLSGAERLVLEILRDAPDHGEALLLLGRIRALDGRSAAAIAPLRAAAGRRPRDPEPRLILAAAHRAARDPGAAEAALREAAEVAPADHRAWSLLASLHREAGDRATARQEIDRAAALAPDDPTVIVTRAGLLNDERAFEDALACVATLDRRPPPSASLRGELESERARALEGLDRPADAWTAITAANRASAADPGMRSVDRGRAAAWIRAYETHLPPGSGPAAEVADGDEAPFDVLVGFSRSGTTMMEQIFAAHPMVVTSGERPIIQRLKRTLGPAANDPDAFARRIAAMGPRELGDLRRRARSIAREEVGGDRPRILHKHPMDAIELPLLERIAPDARVLYAVRDPRDVCVSCLKQRFVPNMVNVHFLDPGTTAELQSLVADAWFARRDQLRCRWTEVRYEDVVDDPATHARTLIDFLGLPWDDAIDTFHEAASKRWISTPSAQAVREAPHRRAVGGWRRFTDEMASVRGPLDRIAARWGYDAS